MRRIDCLVVIDTLRKRGRPRKTLVETIRNDLKTLSLTVEIALDQIEGKHEIHVANPS